MKQFKPFLSAILSSLLLCGMFSFPVKAETLNYPVFENKKAQITENADYCKDSVILISKPDVTSDELDDNLIVDEVTTLMEGDTNTIYEVKIEHGYDIEEAMSILAADDDVLYVEPDYIMEKRSFGGASDSGSKQWHHEYVKTFEAWQLIDALPSHGKTRVAIIDENAEISHTDLSKNVNKSLSCDFSTGKKQALTSTDGFHGTHVGGLVGAVSNNGTGYCGVASGTNNDCVELVFIGLGGDLFTLKTSSVIAAVDYASSNGCKIANMSFGLKWKAESEIAAMQVAVNTALERGMLCVCASGNTSGEAMNFPACLNNTVSVGNLALKNGSLVYGGSCYYKVSVSAPGTNISSTDLNNKYSSQTGSSQSTPIVTGVIALVMSANPKLTSVQAAEIVINTADSLGDYRTGKGCVNAYEAVKRAIEYRNVNVSIPGGSALYNSNKTKQAQIDTVIITAMAYNSIGKPISQEVSSGARYTKGWNACEFYNTFFSSQEFNSCVSQLSDKKYVKIVYSALFGREPTSRELKSGLDTCSRKNGRVRLIGEILKQWRVWVQFTEEYPQSSFGNPYETYYIWNK